jgi:hypothetical protein
MTAPTATIKLEMPNQSGLLEHLKANARWATPKNVIQKNAGDGKRVVICGAGPSIADNHAAIRTTPAHQVWGANSGLTYLVDHGLPVTHGITVDASPEMYTDVNEWQRTFPGIIYLVSSGVDPLLIPHLRKANRPYRIFHSYLGVQNPEGWIKPASWTPPAPGMDGLEMYLYQTIYPPTVQVGYGLNTVPRAICLALWMGFKTITVFGADCACAPGAGSMPALNGADYTAWLETLKLYPDGRSDPVQGTPAKYGPNAVMSQGQIGGRWWHTRPDMLISAQHLVHLALMYPGRVVLMGDTLPNALLAMPSEERDTYMKTMPNLNGKGAVEGFGLNLPA